MYDKALVEFATVVVALTLSLNPVVGLIVSEDRLAALRALYDPKPEPVSIWYSKLMFAVPVPVITGATFAREVYPRI